MLGFNEDEALACVSFSRRARLTDRRIKRLADRKDWKTVLTAEEVNILKDLSATLQAAIDATDPDDCTTEETDFHALWIGLLLGSGECANFGTAYGWATFVRYNTDEELVS
jgi:hypothetical protein